MSPEERLNRVERPWLGDDDELMQYSARMELDLGELVKAAKDGEGEYPTSPFTGDLEAVLKRILEINEQWNINGEWDGDKPRYDYPVRTEGVRHFELAPSLRLRELQDEIPEDKRQEVVDLLSDWKGDYGVASDVLQEVWERLRSEEE